MLALFLRVSLMEKNERQRAILAALVQMDKQFGKGAVLLLGSRNALPVTTISSGSLSVDYALGVGGFPRGRVIRDLWSGIVRENDTDASRDRRSAESRWIRRIHRCRACARSDLCRAL